MQFHSLQVPPPKGWEDFEALCLDLFRRVWDDPMAQRNGRRGQAQAGVDVWGRPTRLGGGTVGVQCKGKDVGLGASVTERELRLEVDKALTFRPDLAEWTLATTGPKDARVERVAREMSAEHERRGLFRIHVLGWDDLTAMLGDHPDVVAKHYPGLASPDPRVLSMLGEASVRQDAMASVLQEMRDMLAAGAAAGAPVRDPAPGVAVDVADLTLQALIDAARDLDRAGKPLTALSSFERLVAERWEGASERARFRLLTNQGACRYHLGAWREAADLFDRARPFGGGDVLAVTNAALAAVLRGEAANARALADEALELAPASVEAATLRVLAAFDEPGVGDPLSLVPGFGASAPVLAMAARWHRERGRSDECLGLLERAHALDPDDADVKVDLAVALVEPIARARAEVAGRVAPGSPGRDLARGTRLLREAWNAARGTEVAAQKVEAALNLALALDLAGEGREAERVVAEARRLAPDDGRVARRLAHHLARTGRHAEALDLLDLFPAAPAEDVEGAVTRFCALAGLGRYEDALALHGALEGLLDGPRLVGARADGVRLLWSLGRREEARTAADGLVSEAPGESRYLLASAFVRQRSGDGEGARSALREALRAMPPDDALGRTIAAEALFPLSDWEGVVEALRPVVPTDRDDDGLRALVAALVNADRRREARTLLDRLPAHVADDPFYRRAGARLGAAVGDLATARVEAESVLAAAPDDLETRLLWLETVSREGDDRAIGAFLDGDLSAFDDAPVRLRVALAGMLDHHGRHGRAMSTGYDTLRSNWGDRDAHKAYHGLILWSRGAVASIPRLDAVGPDAGFVVASPAPGGPPTSYLIEARPVALDAKLGEVAPGSPLASRASGRRAGDRVRIQDHPAADLVEILEVGHKHLRLGRRSLAEFGSLFPDDPSFLGFAMDPADPSKAVGKIRDMALLRRRQAEGVAEAYARGGLPVAMAAHLSGTEAATVWFGLAGMGRSLDVCAGEGAELARATAILSARPGIVLDPLTFWLAGGHGWLGVLRETFGPLGVTRSGLDALRRMADEPSTLLGEGGGIVSAGSEEGTVSFVAPTPEQRRRARDAATLIVEFALGDGAVVLDAMPRRDLDEAARELGRSMDPAFLDAIAAADGAGRVLLCEDRRLRLVAGEALPGGGVPSVWLQPALMRAVEAGAMPRPDYVEATVALALSEHDFTMLDAAALTFAARRDRWSADGDFAKLASVVGSPRVDVRTAAVVVSEFLRDLWSARVPPAARDALTRTLVRALAKGHPDQVPRILDALGRRVRPARDASRLERLRAGARFRDVLRGLADELRAGRA